VVGDGGVIGALAGRSLQMTCLVLLPLLVFLHFPLRGEHEHRVQMAQVDACFFKSLNFIWPFSSGFEVCTPSDASFVTAVVQSASVSTGTPEEGQSSPIAISV